MKHIIKTSPPDEFVKECETPGVSFSTLRSKKNVKRTIVTRSRIHLLLLWM